MKFCTSEEFDSIPGNPYSGNLIVIGGPDYNKITRFFMKYTPFRFIEKNNVTIMENKSNKKPSKSKFTKDDKNEEVIDYGFFLKIPNPENTNKKLIMINGIHTYGVYGAAKCFSLYDENEIDIARSNCKKVINKFGDDPNFTIVVRVKAINKIVGIPEIKQNELISL